MSEDARQHSGTAPLPLSAEQHRLIAENVTDAVWLARIEGLKQLSGQAPYERSSFDVDALLHRWQFTFLSPSAEKVFGYPIDELLRMNPKDFLTPAAYETIKGRFERGLRAALADPEYVIGQPPDVVEHRTKDGQSRWTETSSRFLREPDGTILGCLGVARDVTERVLARRALEASDRKFQQLFEVHPDLVLLVDCEARVRLVNRPVPTAGEGGLVGSIGLNHIAEAYRTAAREAIERTLVTSETQSIEVRTVYGDWWDCRLVAVPGEGDAPWVMIVCMDVTKRKEAEEALLAEQQTLRQLLEVHERERQMTAYEIHDGFAQHAAAALMNFQASSSLHGDDSEQADEAFRRGLNLLRDAVGEARQLISGLRPPILDESGIAAAVDHLLYSVGSDDDLTVDFRHRLPDRLPPSLEATLFRIVQEAVTNARRHSGSPTLHVRLHQESDEIVAEIEDQGVGFDPVRVDPSRFGLKGIRERTRLAGGRAEIRSAPGQGTRVEVRLPYKPQDDAA